MAKHSCLWGIQRWQGLLSQSEVVLELLNDAVALTGEFFEFPAVHNLHCISQVFYDSFFLTPYDVACASFAIMRRTSPLSRSLSFVNFRPRLSISRSSLLDSFSP
jgi:hypothetical protein